MLLSAVTVPPWVIGALVSNADFSNPLKACQSGFFWGVGTTPRICILSESPTTLDCTAGDLCCDSEKPRPKRPLCLPPLPQGTR